MTGQRAEMESIEEGVVMVLVVTIQSPYFVPRLRARCFTHVHSFTPHNGPGRKALQVPEGLVPGDRSDLLFPLHYASFFIPSTTPTSVPELGRLFLQRAK